jgi:hypothetical protein
MIAAERLCSASVSGCPLTRQKQLHERREGLVDDPLRFRRDRVEGPASLDEDVIDDVTISTLPVVIGTGRRLFGGRPQTKTWTLASARSFPSGLVQAHYDRKR